MEKKIIASATKVSYKIGQKILISDSFLEGSVWVTVKKINLDGTLRVVGDPYFEYLRITPDMILKTETIDGR